MKIQDAQVFDFTDGYERLVEQQSQSMIHGWGIGDTGGMQLAFEHLTFAE